jgi:hypothetical protein
VFKPDSDPVGPDNGREKSDHTIESSVAFRLGLDFLGFARFAHGLLWLTSSTTFTAPRLPW